MKLIINSPSSLSKAIGIIRAEWKAHKYIKLTLLTGKHRTLKFNALSWQWYKQISDERGEMTPREVHAFCKLHFAVPIRRRDDPEFNEFYEKFLEPLDYEVKIHILSEIPVSSKFTNAQFKEYMEEVRIFYLSLPTDSVVLEYEE